jgi:hypothetical protein
MRDPHRMDGDLSLGASAFLLVLTVAVIMIAALICGGLRLT